MKADQIKNYYKFVLNELNSFETNIEPLLQFAREYNDNITSILQSFLGAAKIFRDGTDTHYVTSNPSLLSDFSALIKDFKSSFLVFPAFLEYGTMKSRISDYKREHHFKETEIEKFYTVLDDTFTTYQEFLQTSDDRKKAIIFGQSVIKLEEYFTSLKVSYENTIALLSKTDVNEEASEKNVTNEEPKTDDDIKSADSDGIGNDSHAADNIVNTEENAVPQYTAPDAAVQGHTIVG